MPSNLLFKKSNGTIIDKANKPPHFHSSYLLGFVSKFNTGTDILQDTVRVAVKHQYELA